MRHFSAAAIALPLLSIMGTSAAAAAGPYQNSTTAVESTSFEASSSTISTTLTSTETPASTISSTSTTSPSAAPSFCPQVDGQTIVGPDGLNWTVKCSSDSWTGAFGEADTHTSYLGCMELCDEQSSGCTGFTYVGASGTSSGEGAGKCWLKHSIGAYKSAPANYIVASKPSTASASSSSVSSTLSTQTVSSTTVSTPSPTPTSGVYCPEWNGRNFTANSGEVFTIECGIDHYSGNLGDFSTNNFTQCIETCGSLTQCVDVSFVGQRCWMKDAIGFASNSPSVWGARLLPVGNQTIATVS